MYLNGQSGGNMFVNILGDQTEEAFYILCVLFQGI